MPIRSADILRGDMPNTILSKAGGNRMVFYFTATGNSLYAAKKFSPEPISIPQAMRGWERRFSDDSIGIVFPDYSAEPPKMVKDFLRECTFDTPYLYMIITYGHEISDAPEFAAKLARQE